MRMPGSYIHNESSGETSPNLEDAYTAALCVAPAPPEDITPHTQAEE